jgi:hypothetical protein
LCFAQCSHLLFSIISTSYLQNRIYYSKPFEYTPYRYLTVMIVYPIGVFVNRLITGKTNKKYVKDNVDNVITL